MRAGRPLQLADVHRGVVGGVGQSGQLLLQPLLRRHPVGWAQLGQGARIGLGVERMVGVLECLDAVPEAVVQQAREHPGEAQKRLPLLRGQLIGAHGDDVGLAKRDEMLTVHRPGPSRIRALVTAYEQ